MVSRMMMLHRPTDAGTPVFDEKHYVPQSWQIARSWENPFTGGIEDNPAYGLVVHPPLGKQLEALGMMIFGYTPWGWRIISALCAVAVVLLIATISRRLSHSDLVGLLAGVLALSDGILFVTGRSGMLDNFQTFTLGLAAYCFVRDAQSQDGLWANAGERVWSHPLGLRAGFRWWRFLAGVSLGLALSIKWSGLYYMAFAGIAIVCVDWARRRRYGARAPLKGMLILDAFPAFASLVILPTVIYLMSWRAWFASETGVFRHAVESGKYADTQGWVWSFLPESLQNFIYYHVSVMEFHTSLTNSAGHHHSWESKPWSWLVSSRSLMYYNPDLEGVHRSVLLVGTPPIWWLSVPVMLWGIWCVIIHKDRRWVLPVVGFAAGFVPWLFNLDRQMYLFYALNLAPFLIIAIAMALGQILRWQIRPAEPSHYPAFRFVQNNAGIILLIAYMTFAVWNFLYFLPIYTAMPLSDAEWAERMWLPSWQ